MVLIIKKISKIISKKNNNNEMYKKVFEINLANKIYF